MEKINIIRSSKHLSEQGSRFYDFLISGNQRVMAVVVASLFSTLFERIEELTAEVEKLKKKK